MAKKDYYEVLGVSRTATQDEIRKAHRKLVRQYHPDVNKNNPSAVEKFKEVQEAYDILSDEQKRKNYDQFGHAGVAAGAEPYPGADPFEAFRRGQQGRGGGPRSYTWRGGPGVTVEDFDGSGGGIEDIFEELFGRRRGGRGGGRTAPRGRPRPEPQRGADVEHSVTLTFDQAARGTTLPLHINRNGRTEAIEIKIPPGVKDGSRIRIKGKGQESDGAPGDLFIITQVAAHPYFRREGLDVYVDLPVSLYEALLGTKVAVPTLDGPVTLTVPPGTGGGSKLRIRGRGIERNEEKGDQFCIIKVEVPKNLDEEDKEAIQRMAKKHPIDARDDVAW